MSPIQCDMLVYYRGNGVSVARFIDERHRMSNHTMQLEAIEVLYKQFGTSLSFGVRHIYSEMLLDKVADLLGIEAPTPHSKKIKVGNWLSDYGNTDYDLSPNVRVRLVVSKQAEGRGGKAAEYQLQLIDRQS